MRRSLTVILLAAVAGVIWWVLSAQGPATGVPATSPPDDAGSLTAAAEPPRRAEVMERRTVDVARALRIVGEGDSVLLGAELRRYVERADGTVDLEADVLATSDANGRLAHPILATQNQRLLVHRSGYVPAVVLSGFEGEQKVLLERGSRLTVHVITDTGVALPDARVIVSAQVLSTIAGLPGDGLGAPLHPRPVWSCSTGSSGEAVLDCLPPGRYHAKVFHPLYAALGGIEDARPLAISGDVELTFTMQDMYGVVFECPSPEPVESQAWTWNVADLDQSYEVTSRLATCRQELRKRFPNAHVFVHRPAFPRETTKIGCQVVLRDGTFWRGSWPLQPLRELREPVYLEQDTDAHYREVRIELVSKSGRVLDVPLQVGEWQQEYRERPAMWSALPGRPLFLKYGRYAAEPQNAGAWWTTLSEEPMTFELSATVPAGDVVRLQVDADFVPVRVVPVYPEDALLSPLHIWIDDPAQQGLVIANWKPERGPIELLVPAGPISIRTGSAHYENLEFTVEVGPDEVGRRIELPLVERR